MKKILNLSRFNGKKTWAGSILVLAVLSMLTLSITPAYAIKAWAAKHNMTCNACHVGPGSGPLTLTGQNFQRNGFRMTGEDKSTSDWAKLFSFNVKLRAHDSNAAGRNATFEAHAVELFSGGNLSKHFSYFTELYLYENTGRTTSAVNSDLGRGKLADAYLMYNSHPSREIYTTVRFGQITPGLPDSGPRFSETRPYIINNSAVSPNTFRPFQRNFGVSIAQHLKSFHAEFSLVNGTGSSPTNSIDTNETKDFYLVLDQDLGQSTNIGAFGYKGRGVIIPSSGFAWENRFHRYGAFAQISMGQLSFLGMVSGGREQLTPQGRKAKNLGLLGEAAFMVTDKLSLFGRYDFFDPNQEMANDHWSGPMVGAGYAFADSGRVTFEYHKQGKFVSTGNMPWEYRVEVAFMF